VLFSRYLKQQMLLEVAELENLFSILEPFELYQINTLVEQETPFSKSGFLQEYRNYILALKSGKRPSSTFNLCLTKDEDVFEKMIAPNQKIILKPKAPVILFQEHTFFYSSMSQTFHSNVNSKDAIHWGVQFAYPQIAQSPLSKEMIEIKGQFENTHCFKTIQKWARVHTRPTPFLIEDKKINASFRLGLKCFTWIENHPQLNTLIVGAKK
jgi:hypothetical protein